MAAKKQNTDVEKIEPGMVVEAAEGDLGEKDVSKPKVADVVEDQNGNIEKVVVSSRCNSSVLWAGHGSGRVA